MSKKWAVCMSGGGAKGAFQMGVLEALGERGIEIDFLSGSSVGALNAAGFAHVGIKQLKSVWLNIKGKKDILKSSWLSWSPKGIYSTKPLKKIINKHVNKKSNIEAVACAVNLDGQIVYASNQDHAPDVFASWVEASCLIPFIMEPTIGHYFDGGIVEQTPLSYTLSRRDNVIVILNAPTKRFVYDKFEPYWPPIVSYGLRAIDDIMTREVFLNDVQANCEEWQNAGKKVHIIEPPEPLGIDTLDFEPKKLFFAYQKGREVGHAHRFTS